MTGPATTEDFMSRLSLEQLDARRFSATCLPAWPGRAFGGNLAAHSLQAAARTADAGLDPWSLHIYFHAPVRALEHVVYDVEEVKTGRTMAVRRVSLLQDDRLRATALVLLGAPGEGPRHQFVMPATTPPEDLTSQEWVLEPAIVPTDADYDALGYPPSPLVEIRVVPPDDSDDRTFPRRLWIRTVPQLPTDPLTTASVVCAFADLTLGTTALEPHGGRSNVAGLQLGAVELALWFTGSADLHDWTLCAENTAFAGGGHGLAHGIFYNSRGDVVAVALQNALMRASG